MNRATGSRSRRFRLYGFNHAQCGTTARNARLRDRNDLPCLRRFDAADGNDFSIWNGNLDMTDYDTSRRAYALALIASLILATLPAATFAQTESTGIVDSVETSETALAQEDVDSYEPGAKSDGEMAIR